MKKERKLQFHLEVVSSYKLEMTTPAVILGRRIADARRATGMSLRGFAIKSGFDPNQLSRIERGNHNMTITTLLRLSEQLGIQASSLLKDLSIHGDPD